MTRCTIRLFVGLLGSLAATPGWTAEVHRRPDGARLHYDGVYYDYRAQDGIHQIKLWIPPDGRPLKGVFFHGNPGDWGDTRNIPRDERLQEFAARHGFGIMGVSSFPGREVYRTSAKVIFSAMTAWARLGHHPEIEHLPLIARGSSNAGITAYSLTAYAPGRMLCFTPNVGPVYRPRVPTKAMLEVPAILHVGERDEFFPDGMTETRRVMAYARARGARWSWIAEKNKGHQIGHIDDVDMAFYEACIQARLPKDADPSQGPVKLRSVPEASGWLVDPATWEDWTTIAPYERYRGDKTQAGWVINERVAMLYRGVATHVHPVSLTLQGIDAVENPHAAGFFLKSVAGRMVAPRQNLKLVCEANTDLSWTRIELYAGTKRIKTVRRNETCEAEFRVRGRRTVETWVAIMFTEGGPRTSLPVHVLVRDPKVYRALQKQRAQVAARITANRAAEAYGPIQTPRAKEQDPGPTLTAYALSPDVTPRVVVDQKPSSFWAQFSPKHQVLRLRPSVHGAADNPTSKMTDADAHMEVRAAYDADAVYLWFEVTDDAWAPGDALNDAVDFHLAGHDPASIWSAAPGKVFVKPKLFALVLSGMQFQAWLGTRAQPEYRLARNFADPWDTRRVEATYEEAARFGLIIDRIEPSPRRRCMEWRIPWVVATNGRDTTAPSQGARLGITLGYNDHDPNEHAPDQTDRLRWPPRADPWWQPGEKGPNPSPWATLRLGPPLPKAKPAR